MKLVLIGNFETINIFLDKYKKMSVLEFITNVKDKEERQDNLKVVCQIGGKYEKK